MESKDRVGRKVWISRSPKKLIEIISILSMMKNCSPTTLGDTLQYRSDIPVELIGSIGTDEMVCKAARVSTLGSESIDTGESAALINFLMKNRHGTPFEHNAFIFRVEAPIFVWREHMRHRIASYNEESGRYKQLDPVFYVPDSNRPLVQIGKTGAYDFIDGTHSQHFNANLLIGESSRLAYKNYEEMLDRGIAKEVARMCLPVNIYSSAYVTMNARALMNFLSLRTKSVDSAYPSFPQHEIAMVADQYEQYLAAAMPLTYKSFVDCGRVAP